MSEAEITSLISAATPDLFEAIRLETELGRPNDAFHKYMAGIDRLIKAINLMKKDDPRKGKIKEQVGQYMSRAENLQSQTKVEVHFVEQRRIAADSIGHSYESVFGKCIDDKLTEVKVQDAYIVAHHQLMNFVTFCELLVEKGRNMKSICLVTGTDGKSNESGFKELADSLLKHKIKLTVQYSPSIHDREIRFNNGWMIKIGRGLGYFKNPGKYVIGRTNQNFCPCHETTIDIWKEKK